MENRLYYKNGTTGNGNVRERRQNVRERERKLVGTGTSGNGNGNENFNIRGNYRERKMEGMISFKHSCLSIKQ